MPRQLQSYLQSLHPTVFSPVSISFSKLNFQWHSNFNFTLGLYIYILSINCYVFLWNLEIEVPPKYGGTFTVHLWQYHLAFSMTCLSFNPGVKILLTESVRKGGVGQGWVGIPISREYKPQIFLPFPWHFKFPFPFPGKGNFSRELRREILSLFAFWQMAGQGMKIN